MDTKIKVSETDFSKLLPNTKVRSLVSHVEGIIISQDPVNKEVEIQWTRGEEVSIIRKPVKDLTSVIMVY